MNRISRKPFKNYSGEAIPAWAIMKITGQVVENGQPLLKVSKPDGATLSQYITNGPKAVAIDGYGNGFWTDDICVAAWDPLGDTPADLSEFGPVADSWYLSGDGSGFIVVGVMVSLGLCRVAKLGGGGTCSEVDEFSIADGTPTSGSGLIGYTLDRDPSDMTAATYDTFSVPFDATNVDFRDALFTHSLSLSSSDAEVFGGPWPDVSIYVLWKGDFSARAIPFPSVAPDSLNNGAVIKMRKASSADWQGF